MEYCIVLSDITIKDVEVVSKQSDIGCVVDSLLRTSHDFVVIEDKKSYFLMTIFDVIRVLFMHGEVSLANLPFHEPMYVAWEGASVEDVLPLMGQDTDVFAVVDDQGRFSGVVEQSDLISSIDPATLMKYYRLKDLFKIKKRNRWIGEDVIMVKAIEEMIDKHFDAYLVVDKRKPLGVITAKDIIRLLQRGIDIEAKVKEYMSQPVCTLAADATLEEALRFIQTNRFNRIITVDAEGNVVGSLTKKELVSITYTKWVSMISRYQQGLREMNEKLEAQTREFEKIATYDNLTGLYNRRKFLELYKLEHIIMRRRNKPTVFMMIDIDHFKKINDTCGHNKGDEVLKTTASILKEVLRSVDIVARWGGDEFVALLPAADCEVAKKIAQTAIAAKVRKMTCNGQRVTVSIGICTVGQDEELHQTLERADRALYEAKRQGRDRVVCV